MYRICDVKSSKVCWKGKQFPFLARTLAPTSQGWNCDCDYYYNYYYYYYYYYTITVFTRLSAAALFKFLVFRMPCLFEGGARSLNIILLVNGNKKC